MRQSSRFGLLLAALTAASLLHAQNTASTTRPSMPPATGPRVPAAAHPPAPPAPGLKYYTAKQLTREWMEQFLRNAPIVSTRPAGKGITHTLRVTLSDGRVYHDAHVQQIDFYRAVFRTTEGVERNFSDSYKYNIAAYRLDKLLDLDMIPVCVYRVINGKPSAIDWWVDDVLFDEEGRRAKNADPPDLNYWGQQLNDLRDFDQLIYNEDRNQGNLLIDKNWKVWGIDESRSFRTIPTLRDPSVLRRISSKLLKAMKNLNEAELEANLEPFVSKEAIQALLARRDLLVKFFDTQISQKGQQVVLTDLPVSTPKVTIP